MTQAQSKRKTLGVILTITFIITVVVGLGIGLALINPDASDPNATFIIFGMPIIYVWSVFWFFVQAAVVIIAYCCLWGKDSDEA